jgi:hypothetical protein
LLQHLHPGEITVYRGVNREHTDSKKAESFTTSKQEAKGWGDHVISKTITASTPAIMLDKVLGSGQSEREIVALGSGTAHDAALASDAKNKNWWDSFAVKFEMTDRMREAVKMNLRDNVDLISSKRIKDGPSIPRKAFREIRAMAKESIEKGRDLVGMTKHIEERFGVTRRRAALIARDQNNKMTSAFHRVRQLDNGVTKAMWVHTAASIHPREEHEMWGSEGAVYDVEEGMYSEVDDEQVWPGTPVNCGCLSQSIIPGYED